MTEYQVRATGIAWYRREDYARLKKMFKDGRKLPDTFDKWLKDAQGIYDKLQSEGAIVEKAYIDPETFPEWCKKNGHQLDAAARMEYANRYVAEKYKTH